MKQNVTYFLNSLRNFHYCDKLTSIVTLIDVHVSFQDFFSDFIRKKIDVHVSFPDFFSDFIRKKI